MNYLKHYKLLVKKAKNRQIGGYTESHHIIPKSIMLIRKPRLELHKKRKSNLMNQPWNIVKLTAREHFVAHLLLAKITKNTPYYTKMLYAVNNFIIRKADDIADYHITSRTYNKIKEEFSKMLSEKNKGHSRKWSIEARLRNTGKNNVKYGTKWDDKQKNGISGKNSKRYGTKHNTETIEKIRKSNLGKPKGPLSQSNKDKRKSKKRFLLTYKNGIQLKTNVPLSDFCKQNGYCWRSFRHMLNGKRYRHKDIIKIEEIKYGN